MYIVSSFFFWIFNPPNKYFLPFLMNSVPLLSHSWRLSSISLACNDFFVPFFFNPHSTLHSAICINHLVLGYTILGFFFFFFLYKLHCEADLGRFHDFVTSSRFWWAYLLSILTCIFRWIFKIHVLIYH